ncbi:MAG: hypothetical protein AAF790_06975 [Planctomycetota bacterium]
MSDVLQLDDDGIGLLVRYRSSKKSEIVRRVSFWVGLVLFTVFAACLAFAPEADAALPHWVVCALLLCAIFAFACGVCGKAHTRIDIKHRTVRHECVLGKRLSYLRQVIQVGDESSIRVRVRTHLGEDQHEPVHELLLYRARPRWFTWTTNRICLAEDFRKDRQPSRLVYEVGRTISDALGIEFDLSDQPGYARLARRESKLKADER